MLIFQVRLYRLSLSNIQIYDTTNLNNPPNMHFSYPSPSYNKYPNNIYINGYTCSDYALPGKNVPDKYPNYDMHNRYNWLKNDERQMYNSNPNSPNTDMYSFSHKISKTREIITWQKQSYPRPFRTSTSAGALIDSFKSSKDMSPSKEYSRKPIHHSIGNDQKCSQDVNGYTSLPIITTSNIGNDRMARRNKAQSLVVGK